MTQSAVHGVTVRDMEGLAASVLLIAILLGVLLVVGGLVYLLAQRLPKRSPEPQSPREERCGIYTGCGYGVIFRQGSVQGLL